MSAPDGLPAGYPLQPELETTPREVKRALDARDRAFVLIDCRTQDEWQTARIDGAVLIPLDEFPARLNEIEAMADDRAVAIHCHRGVRSLRAALWLRQQGVEAKSMAGGIDLWSTDIDPSVPRY